MSMSITAELQKIESENEALKSKVKDYKKLLDKALKIELGLGIADLEKRLKTNEKNDHEPPGRLEQILKEKYAIKTLEDQEQFLQIICSKSVMDFYEKHRLKKGLKNTQSKGMTKLPETTAYTAEFEAGYESDEE